MNKEIFLKVRCTLAERIELEERAEGNISRYVRRFLFEEPGQRLESIERRLDELVETVYAQAGRSQHVEEVRDQGRPTDADTETKGMLLELLLLMRMTASRTNMQAAQAEVERQGLPVFEDRKSNKK